MIEGRNRCEQERRERKKQMESHPGKVSQQKIDIATAMPVSRPTHEPVRRGLKPQPSTEFDARWGVPQFGQFQMESRPKECYDGKG